MPEFRAYAQRRLSPFKGTVQVLFVENGRALSYDGEFWIIQLRSEQPVARTSWGNIDARRTTLPWFNYGGWTPDGEIRRLPTNPAVGDVSGYAALPKLLEALTQQPSCPYPLDDRFECWLVDGEGIPVALFASACDEKACELPRHPRWQATAADDPVFHSTALEQASTAQSTDVPHAAWLVERVTRRCGMPLSVQWFRRADDGSGLGLAGRHIRPEWQGRTLAADTFPALPLREDWDDDLTAAVAQNLLDHLAPFLLMLPGLTAERRQALEIAACDQPQVLLSVRRLLPEMVDKDRIDTALVRARLELAQR